MEAATLQARIYAGYSKAALRIGTTFSIYRSADGLTPIKNANLQGTVLASANINWEYTRFNKYGNAVWQLIADGRVLQKGDYIVGNNTFFIAAMQPLLPIMAVECNQEITVMRPYEEDGIGAMPGYAGNTGAKETLLLQDCPCSILEGTKGDQSPAKLPGDTKMPWVRCLLPYLGDITIKTGDIVIDKFGVRYVVSGDELTDLGWRLTLNEVGA
jgi:hypothetical protein